MMYCCYLSLAPVLGASAWRLRLHIALAVVSAAASAGLVGFVWRCFSPRPRRSCCSSVAASRCVALSSSCIAAIGGEICSPGLLEALRTDETVTKPLPIGLREARCHDRRPCVWVDPAPMVSTRHSCAASRRLTQCWTSSNIRRTRQQWRHTREQSVVTAAPSRTRYSCQRRYWSSIERRPPCLGRRWRRRRRGTPSG